MGRNTACGRVLLGSKWHRTLCRKEQIMRKKNMKLAVTSAVLSACVAVQPVAACAAEGANLADENTAGGGVNSGNPAEESAPQQPNEEIVAENEGIIGTPGTEGTEDQAGQESSGNYEIVEDNRQEEEEPAEPEEEAASSESQPAESAETTESAESTEEKSYPDSEKEISAGQGLNGAGDAVLEKPEGETVEEYNEKVEDYNEKVDGYNDVVTGDNAELAENFTGEGSADKLDEVKDGLDKTQNKVATLQAELNALEALKNDPNPDKPFSIEEYNQKVAELNAAVEKQQTAAGDYNAAVDKIQTEKQEEVIQENQGINSDNQNVVTENEQTMDQNAGKLGKTEETGQTIRPNLDVEALQDSDLKDQYKGAKSDMEDAKEKLEKVKIPSYDIETLTPEQVAEYKEAVGRYNELKRKYDEEVKNYNSLADQVAAALNEQAHDKVTASNKEVTDANKETADGNQKAAEHNTEETKKNDIEELEDVKSALDDAADKLAIYKGKLEAAQNVLNELDPESENYYQRYDEQLERYVRAVEEYNKVQKAYNSAVEGYRGALNTVKESVVNRNADAAYQEKAGNEQTQTDNCEEASKAKNEQELTAVANKLETANQNLNDAREKIEGYKNADKSGWEAENWEQYNVALNDYQEAFKDYNTAVAEFNTAASSVNKDITAQNKEIVDEALSDNNAKQEANTQKKDNLESAIKTEVAGSKEQLDAAEGTLNTWKENLSKIAAGEPVKEGDKTYTFEEALAKYNQAVTDYNTKATAYNTAVDGAVSTQNSTIANEALQSNEEKMQIHGEKLENYNVDKATVDALKNLNDAKNKLLNAAEDATSKEQFDQYLEAYNNSLDAYNEAVKALNKDSNQIKMDPLNDQMDQNTKMNITNEEGGDKVYQINNEPKSLASVTKAVEEAEKNMLQMAQSGNEEDFNTAKGAYEEAVETYNEWINLFNDEQTKKFNQDTVDQNNAKIEELNQKLQEEDTLADEEDAAEIREKNRELQEAYKKIQTFESRLTQLQNEIDGLSGSERYQKINEYNTLVSQYNKQVGIYNTKAGDYNKKVDSSSASGNAPIEAGVPGEGEADWGNVVGNDKYNGSDKNQHTIKNLDYIDVRKTGTDGSQITGVYANRGDKNLGLKYTNAKGSGEWIEQALEDADSKGGPKSGGEFEHPNQGGDDRKDVFDATQSEIQFVVAIKKEDAEQDIQIDVKIGPNTCYAVGTRYYASAENAHKLAGYENTNREKIPQQTDENGEIYYDLSGMSVYVVSAILSDKHNGENADSFQWDKKNAEGLELLLDTETILKEYQKQNAQKLSYITKKNFKEHTMDTLNGSIDITQFGTDIEALEAVTAMFKDEKGLHLEELSQVETIEQNDLYHVGKLTSKPVQVLPKDVTLQETGLLTMDDLQMQGNVEEVKAAKLSPLEEKNLLTGFTDYTKTAEAHLNKAASQIKALFIELGGGGTTDPETDPDPDPEIDPETDPDPDPETDPDPDVEIPEGDVPLAELPTQQVPLTELPEGQTPILVELTEEQVPLTELPDEAVPMARPAKTGDTTPMLALSTALAGAALALTKLLERKRHTAKHAKH